MARLFVAVRPPPATLDLIAGFPRPEIPGVRWTRRDQWHVTLLFLAEADVATVTDRLVALDASAVVATLGPSPARLGRGVVVLPVDGLDPLAAAVHTAVGVPPDRPFVGHLTLARVDRRAAGSAVRGRGGFEAPSGYVGSPTRGFEVGEVELVRSELRAGGAAHTVELTVPLGSAV